MRLSSLALLLVFSLAAAAAPIDGKWRTEIKTTAGKKKGGQPQTVPATLDLKSQGDRLTGTVLMSRGRKGQPMEIQDGKIDGNRIAFTIVRKGKKGETKQQWQGTLEGDELRGSFGRGKRGTPFVARRSGT